MKKVIRQYRNMHDFKWGSFKVRTGSGWMQITGVLKKTGLETAFMDIKFETGHGTVMMETSESD